MAARGDGGNGSSGAHRPVKVARKAGDRTPREIVEAIVAGLPGTACVAHESHLSLEVRGKRFGWFLDDHHGDGRVVLHVKSTAERRGDWLQAASDQVFVPPYVGHRGWLGCSLDGDGIDWRLVRQVLAEAYRRTAPKRLAAQLDTDAD